MYFEILWKDGFVEDYFILLYFPYDITEKLTSLFFCFLYECADKKSI